MNPDEVDLKYILTLDRDNLTVTVKFGGFEDADQIDQFADFLEDNLPLLFFDSNVKH